MGEPAVGQTDLSQFRGQHYLGTAEKAYRMEEAARLYEEGWIDKEMWPYLERLNAIPYVCTTQSCCGHDGDPLREPHVDIRIGATFDDFFARLKPLEDAEHAEVYIWIMGWEMMMPRFCFWFKHDSWRESIELLIRCLE